MQKQKLITIFSISLILASIMVTIGATFVVREIKRMKSVQINQYIEHQRTNQLLLSTIDWSTNRTKTILFMRDNILNECKSVGCDISYEKAYLIAETNMLESEKYPHINPLFMLAIQRCESSFNDEAKSHRGAIGLMQLMPSTARLICGFFQLEYNTSLLYDIKTNVKFGAKLLDVLYVSYDGNIEMILADYNGGPYSAYYYSTKDSKLSKETAKYVPCVIEKLEQYENEFNLFKVNSRN